MDIGCAWRDLGPVDIEAFGWLNDPASEHWLQPNVRAHWFDVHRETTSVIFRFADLDNWPRLRLVDYDPWLACVHDIHALTTTLAARLGLGDRQPTMMIAARLRPGAAILPHRDDHPYFAATHRIHVPIAAPPGVRFTVGDTVVPLSRARAFEVNNRWVHAVTNEANAPRIHLIVDFLA